MNVKFTYPGNPTVHAIKVDLTAATLNELAAVLGETGGEDSLAAHTANTSNPHSVTKAQVGLANAENTADAAKPVSTATQTALDLKAPLASPAFTGTPSAPTAAQGTNTTQLASTAFVRAEVAALVDASPGTLDTLNELAAALGDDANFAATTAAAIGDKQPLATVLTNTTAAFTTAQETKLAGVETGAQVNAALASQGEAQAGSDNTKTMTPLRTAEAIAAHLRHFRWSFNPKAVCDGDIDRLALMTVGPDFPNGLKITRWNLSFLADPATEVDLDFKRADAFIGVANAAVVDVLDTTAGVSSEATAANINADAAVANGKVLYLEFGTPYTADSLQIIFEFWGYAV